MFRLLLASITSLTVVDANQAAGRSLSNAVLHYGPSQSEGYTSHNKLPQSEPELKVAGWEKSDRGKICPGFNEEGCHKNLGYFWENKNGDGHLFHIFTNAKGMISGYAWGVQQWQDITKGSVEYYFDECMNYVAIATREGPNSADKGVQCDPDKASTGDIIGDHVWVNPNGASQMEIPLTRPSNFEETWYKGSCFDGMGTHYFHDLHYPGHMSWDPTALFPLVTMYDDLTGRLNAVFMTLPKRENGVLPFQNNHDYDKIYLENFLFCQNTCSSKCTMKGTYGMTTGHLWFGDYKQITPCNRETYQCSTFLKGVHCCPRNRAIKEDILV